MFFRAGGVAGGWGGGVGVRSSPPRARPRIIIPPAACCLAEKKKKKKSLKVNKSYSNQCLPTTLLSLAAYTVVLCTVAVVVP